MMILASSVSSLSRASHTKRRPGRVLLPGEAYGCSCFESDPGTRMVCADGNPISNELKTSHPHCHPNAQRPPIPNGPHHSPRRVILDPGSPNASAVSRGQTVQNTRAGTTPAPQAHRLPPCLCAASQKLQADGEIYTTLGPIVQGLSCRVAYACRPASA